nr:hypothetical protein [uncultured Methanolobus sp.]
MWRQVIIEKTGDCNVYWHLKRLASFGYISREKRGKQTYYHLTAEGAEILAAGDFKAIRQIVPFVDIVTPLMLEIDRPATVQELHEMMNDPRSMQDFNSLVLHLRQRGYIESDENSAPHRYYLTERGREHGRDPAEYRRKKNLMRFQ